MTLHNSTFVSVCLRNLDVVFVIDVSGSIEEPNFQKIIQFIISITLGLDIENGLIRVGVLTFSDASMPQVGIYIIYLV